MIRVLTVILLGCIFKIDARVYQYEDWTPSVKTVEYKNLSKISFDDPETSKLDESNPESLDQFIPSEFESRMMRSASDIMKMQVEAFFKGPVDTVKEINDVGYKGITSNVHENISKLYVKLFTYFIRGYAFMSRSLLSSYKAIGGSTCYQLPDIEKIFKVFTLKNGEMCPFHDFELQNVQIKSHPNKWVVEMPLLLKKVKVVFSSIQLYTPMLSTPAWTFESTDVLVNMTLGLSKSIVPYPVSLGLKVNIKGCSVSDPDSNWIIRKLLKLTSKICDPVLNQIIKATLLVAKVDLKVLGWVAKMAFNGDLWVYSVVEWILKKLQSLLEEQENYVS